MRAFRFSLILLATALTISAVPQLGLSIGDHASFDILHLAFLPTGNAEALHLRDGAAETAQVEAFLSNRPREPKGFQLKLVTDTAKCSALKDKARANQPLGRSSIRLSDGSKTHQFTVLKTRIGNVQCSDGAALVELQGNRITYDGNVPK